VNAVIDLFSRRVVGWSMNAAMTAQLVTDALRRASARMCEPLECPGDLGTPAAIPSCESISSRNGSRDIVQLGSVKRGNVLRALTYCLPHSAHE
jgi:hypothetical protein